MAKIAFLRARRCPDPPAADPGAPDDKRNALRGQMLAATNFYQSGRLSAADAKASSTMAISGVGIGFLVQRSPMQAASAGEALWQVLAHPSMVLLLSAILLAAWAQRAVKKPGRDWLSHLVAGREPARVADEFMEQSAEDLLTNWIHSQGLMTRIAQRKYRLVNRAMILMLTGFSCAVIGL